MTETIEYQGYNIRHFPYIWQDANGNTIQEVDGWVILSPAYIETSDGEKLYVPLYAQDEEGVEVEFHSLQEAKDYIDKYIVADRGRFQIAHGECHYVINK